MLLLSLALVGCGASNSRYYTFPNVKDSDMTRLGRVNGVIVVGPITLNEEIDRPQLVIRRSPTQVEIKERDFWAGSLQQEIQQQVIGSLSKFLDSDKVVPFPWLGAEGATYRVSLEVMDMTATPGGEAELALTWSIYNERTRKQIKLQTLDYRAMVPADADLDVIVRIYSQLQQRAVRDLAQRLVQLVGHRR
jgi:uncharacterized lipoprotein YmbA